MINVSNNRLDVKDPTTVSRHVDKVANNVLRDVCDVIAAVSKDLPSIGFTSDLWTFRRKICMFRSLLVL